MRRYDVHKQTENNALSLVLLAVDEKIATDDDLQREST